jgi:hypothetical protein
MKTILIQTCAIAAFAFLAESAAFAGSFTITSPLTTAQTLGSGAGQTGTITATGSLTVSGTTNAVTISGNNATLTNLMMGRGGLIMLGARPLRRAMA